MSTEDPLTAIGPSFGERQPVQNGNGRSLDEREAILQTLHRYQGNRLQAAVELGMHRTTLWRKMKTLGIGS